MGRRNRRAFLAEVGQGMLVASVGYHAAVEMGLSPVMAEEAASRLSFGPRESLVGLMQDTPVDRLLPALVKQLEQGVTLKELVASAALANARTFGGEDYIGFHSFMALAPAWHMSNRLPANRAALPVFKVLYRNTNRMQEQGGSQDEVLHPVEPAAVSDTAPLAEQIRQAIRDKNLAQAEQLLAASAARSPEDAFNDLLPVVDEAVEVHRTVLAYRGWDLLDLVGREHAMTFLRQSLHYSVTNCKPGYESRFAEIREQLPKLLDSYRLAEREPGSRVADDAWIESTCDAIIGAEPYQAADTIAAALADGMSRDSVAEVISLAANQLVLRDEGRTARNAQPNKPVGSVHGDSIGVHASDSINAWRNIAAISNRRNSVASLILAGWQVASDRRFTGNNIATTKPRPEPEQVARVTVRDQAALLRELDDAIRQQDQARACAVVYVYGEQDLAPEPVADLLLNYAISEDGALHAEKYFNTANEEFARARKPFRWRHMVGLARVTASEYGRPAPGIDEAKRLLNV